LIDKELETAKQDLALRPDFNLLDFFRTFDTHARGFISLAEIEDGLAKFGVNPIREELYLWLRKHDRDNDGKLKFSEFAEAFTPKQGEYSNLLNSRDAVNGDLYLDLHHLFKLETRSQINKVLRLSLEAEGSSESLRQKLNKKFGFSTHDAFAALDLDENGVIDSRELKDALAERNTFLTEKELHTLIDRLDKNKDGVISYSEFVHEIQPKSDKIF